jgi:hypothetical protein
VPLDVRQYERLGLVEDDDRLVARRLALVHHAHPPPHLAELGQVGRLVAHLA